MNGLTSNQIKKTKNNKGFTLIELIVVIAILGILAAIAVPRLMGVRENAELKADQATGRVIASAVSIMEADTGAGPAAIGDLVPTYLDAVPVTAVETAGAGVAFSINDVSTGAPLIVTGNGTQVYPIP